MGKYQLVVQLTSDDADAISTVSDLEEVLVDPLDGIAEVEGFEMGEGAANLTFDTDQPKKTWAKLEPVLDEMVEEKNLTIQVVAYRGYDDEDGDYTVLWPADFEGDIDL
ncbi:MAG: hypothetical protein AB7E80_12680 [Hyphomicrobiaceae bacterium]